MRLGRRLFVVALAVLFSAGNAAVCAGWAATPEARMACCTQGACPMHDADAQGTDATTRAVTQAQADTCCASSEHDRSNPSNRTSVAALTGAVPGTSVALPAAVPALVLTAGRRTSAVRPSPHVPTHVLLSVFLV